MILFANAYRKQIQLGVTFGMVIIMLTANVFFVKGDGGSFAPEALKKMLDIQGAKYVSEGGYYFIQLINKTPENMTIELQINIENEDGFHWFEEANYERLSQTEGYGYVTIYYRCTIPGDTVIRWHFVAPQVKESDGYSTIAYQFTWVHNRTKSWATDYRGWLTTHVADINVLRGGLNGDKFRRNFTDVLKENRAYRAAQADIWDKTGINILSKKQRNKLTAINTTDYVADPIIIPDSSTQRDMIVGLFFCLFAVFVLMFDWKEEKRWWKKRTIATSQQARRHAPPEVAA